MPLKNPVGRPKGVKRIRICESLEEECKLAHSSGISMRQVCDVLEAEGITKSLAFR